MAWAVFHRPFDWSRPGSKFSFHAEPSARPKSWVHDFVDAAVAAGAAKRIHLNRSSRPPK